MMCGELLHQGSGEALAQDEQKSDHDVVVALVVVQLRVLLENPQNDVNQLLLQTLPLLIGHPCTRSAQTHLTQAGVTVI